MKLLAILYQPVNWRPILHHMSFWRGFALSRSAVLLIGTSGFLILVLILEIGAPLNLTIDQEGKRAKSIELPAVQQVAFTPPPIERFESFDERPLFSRARKPWLAAADRNIEISDQPPPPPNVELMGVLLAGEDRLAIVKPSGAETRTIHTADTIDGWQVSSIEEDRLVLSANEDQFHMDVMLRPTGNNAPSFTEETPINSGSNRNNRLALPTVNGRSQTSGSSENNE